MRSSKPVATSVLPRLSSVNRTSPATSDSGTLTYDMACPQNARGVRTRVQGSLVVVQQSSQSRRPVGWRACSPACVLGGSKEAQAQSILVCLICRMQPLPCTAYRAGAAGSRSHRDRVDASCVRSRVLAASNVRWTEREAEQVLWCVPETFCVKIEYSSRKIAQRRALDAKYTGTGPH